MQVNLHDSRGNQFTNYSETSVTINQIEYQQNLIVTPQQVINCPLHSIQELTLANLSQLTQYQPDLIIFGCGQQITYPAPEVLRHLQQQHIGFEVMTIAALCRTFNYLIGEGRQVVGLILF